MQLIGAAPHEFAAHFRFDEYDPDPFFAFDRRIKDGGGRQRTAFTFGTSRGG